MKLLDLNLLLYAVNSDSAHHRVAKPWLETALNDDEPVALPWAVLLGFLRIATNKRILPRPLSAAQAMAVTNVTHTAAPSPADTRANSTACAIR